MIYHRVGHLEGALTGVAQDPPSLGMWAITDGTPSLDGQQFPKGSFIRIAEWYCCERDQNGSSVPNTRT